MKDKLDRIETLVAIVLEREKKLNAQTRADLEWIQTYAKSLQADLKDYYSMKRMRYEQQGKK